MFTPTSDFLSQSCAAQLAPLGSRPAEAAANAALDQIFALAEQSWQARRSSLDYLRSAPPSACRAGCGWCCHQQVGVTPLEAIRIVAFLRALPTEAGKELVTAVHDLNPRTQGMTTGQRADSRLPCAFLGLDGNCRIYPVRPLRCRGLHSIDAGFCAASHSDPEGMRSKLEQGQLSPVYLSVPEAIFDSALSGVLMGLRRLKMAVVSLELHAAVAALLADSRLARRWLGGAVPARALALVPDPPARNHSRNLTQR